MSALQEAVHSCIREEVPEPDNPFDATRYCASYDGDRVLPGWRALPPRSTRGQFPHFSMLECEN